MKAMILAAGLGTRLRPLTDRRPKALVEIGRQTLLEITLMRLRAFGVREVVINVHHFADMVTDYLRERSYFGMRIEISCEEELLDTGGGLKNAAGFFLRDRSDPNEAFILHNADVISTIDLGRMVSAHVETRALSTLAVQHRDTSRYLLFDEDLQLCGRRAGHAVPPEMVRACREPQALAFCGIHVISSRIFDLMTEHGVFSIIPVYLRLAADGERIGGFQADEFYWRDLGTPASVKKVAEELKSEVSLR